MPVRCQVKVTRTAEKDLGDIWDHILKDGPGQADKFFTRFSNQVTTLERYPERCPLIPENEVLGTTYRHILNGDYRTVFRVDHKMVYILRVIHGSRLLDDSVFG